jgi:hypothetical protein
MPGELLAVAPSPNLCSSRSMCAWQSSRLAFSCGKWNCSTARLALSVSIRDSSSTLRDCARTDATSQMFSATRALNGTWNDAPPHGCCRVVREGPDALLAGAELVDQLDLRLDLEVLVVPLRADLVRERLAGVLRVDLLDASAELGQLRFVLFDGPRSHGLLVSFRRVP